MEKIKTVNQLPANGTDLHREFENILKGPHKEQFLKEIAAGNATEVRKTLAGAGVVGIDQADVYIVSGAKPGGASPEFYTQCEPKKIIVTTDPKTGKKTIYIECK